MFNDLLGTTKIVKKRIPALARTLFFVAFINQAKNFYFAKVVNYFNGINSLVA